ncbi:PDZ domain-containing protein [Chitinimonas sp. BJYL2]|uniref:PDZ domain-containing protein n=1 Tax=Chitinimonas sp. BJYL2 TaxID=2976696 RepID=UPI0022B4456B|nr:PDZ domain-containing protein [Chitinimonas sp. BJYL2]
MLYRKALLAPAMISLLCLPALAGEGSVGISVSVSVDGIFSPTLKAATIKEVKPGSPAEDAGVKAGDLIRKIDDCAIPGCPGSRAKTLMDKAPGEILRLTLERADKRVEEVSIKVGRKPGA